MAGKKLTAVAFTKGYRSWNAGEVAGFDSAYAKKLVAANVAKYANKPGPKPVEAAPAEAPAEELPDLTKLNKGELIALVEEAGKDSSGLTKAELISLLEDDSEAE